MNKNVIPERLQKLGLVSMSTHSYYRGELIFIQGGKYYPTIACGDKSAAVFNSRQEAEAWIDKQRQGSNELDVVYSNFRSEEELVSIKSTSVATVVFISKYKGRVPIVYDTTGIEAEYVDEAVKAMVARLTVGCNYDYEFVHKVGNVYFFK